MPPAPTAQQRRAIDAEGNVLVMAGAGAGKTTTLVSRILDRVLDRPAATRASLDRLLVVTFNEAAATETRHRLRLALESRARLAPDDGWLAEQLALLDGAFVSTLHAFCLRLVRDHFHELGLDPQFVVQDEVQSRMLREQTLDTLLRLHLGSPSSDPGSIRGFLERHGRDRLPSVRDLVTRVHDYARSLPDPEHWLGDQRRSYASSDPGPWLANLGTHLAEWAGPWLAHCRQVIEDDPGNLPADACLGALERLNRSETPLDPAAIAELLAAIAAAGDKERHPGREGGRWRKPIKGLVEEAVELREYLAPARPDGTLPVVEDWNWTRHDVLGLLRFVEEFDRRFAEARRALASVDFADLEQLALRLLWDSEKHQPTGLAVAWQERLDHVLVDEYQDINGAQDRILQALSRPGPGANRFFVGDVKQSIYRFRRADPRIFQGYARQWRDAAHHAVVPLTENFRSHRAILDFVNELFGQLMRRDLGGIEYDREAQLILGAADQRPAYVEDPAGRVELLLVPKDPAKDSNEATTTAPEPAENTGDHDGDDDLLLDLDLEEAQARETARRLAEFRSRPLEIWDPSAGARRAVTWRDMVVLHSAPRTVAERWARTFADAGIPLEARRGGFFEALEVSDLVNLVRLLDNPIQDLPLLAVLRSPLAGMTVEELTVVRLADRRSSLWDALHRRLEEDPHDGLAESFRAHVASARAKGEAFVGAFHRWRRLAREGSLAACLETALAETGYEAWLAAQPRADARLANLRRLLALSRQFDTFQRHGLFRFVQFLEAQERLGDRIPNAPAVSGDCVRLLSMHQSKGLEFPVVVVAGLGHGFNTEELRGDWLIDPDLGLCPPVVPPGLPRGYHSLPRWLAERRQLREALGEQVRLFYVACTRAADRLLLVGAARRKRLEAWAETSSVPTSRALASARCLLDWLGPEVASLTGQADWTTTPSGTGRRLDWHHLPPATRATPTTTSSGASGTSGESTAPADQAPPPERIQELRRRVEWQYPQPAATREPAKAAVTALRRRWMRDEEAASPPPPTRLGTRGASSTVAVERGIAHHLFNERVDLARTGTREELAAEARRLEDEGWLSPEQSAALDLEGLAAFWISPLGDELRAHRDAVQRELPFTARLRPHEAHLLGGPSPFAGARDDDFQVIQGVADLAVLLADEIWIVDFKTDRVDADGVEARATEYRPQLDLYAHALSSIYRRPVTRRLLYFIAARQLI